jgi:tetratricopeptide (TPR) repeat protein
MKRVRRIELVLLFALGIRSGYSAQDPLILLEKGIYAEETLGNLNDAIGIYQQVVIADTASRATSALALFRLGMCYQKSGRADQAQATFAKLLKQYPEQQDLIAQIPGISTGPVALRPAPWANGESLQLLIKFPSGLQAGTLIYKFDSTVDSGRMAWRVQSIQNVIQNASVLIDAATFLPIGSLVDERSTGRQYQANYGSRQIDLAITGSSFKQKTFPLNRTTYDEQQLIQILRCLSLQEGYQIAIPTFSSNHNNALVDVQIAVVAKEIITVPAGTFDCYKTILTRGNQSPLSTYWISADSHSYIIKVHENRLMGGTVPILVHMELSSIGVDRTEGQGDGFISR